MKKDLGTVELKLITSCGVLKSQMSPLTVCHQQWYICQSPIFAYSKDVDLLQFKSAKGLLSLLFGVCD